MDENRYNNQQSNVAFNSDVYADIRGRCRFLAGYLQNNYNNFRSRVQNLDALINVFTGIAQHNRAFNSYPTGSNEAFNKYTACQELSNSLREPLIYAYNYIVPVMQTAGAPLNDIAAVSDSLRTVGFDLNAAIWDMNTLGQSNMSNYQPIQQLNIPGPVRQDEAALASNYFNNLNRQPQQPQQPQPQRQQQPRPQRQQQPQQPRQYEEEQTARFGGTDSVGEQTARFGGAIPEYASKLPAPLMTEAKLDLLLARLVSTERILRNEFRGGKSADTVGKAFLDTVRVMQRERSVIVNAPKNNGEALRRADALNAIAKLAPFLTEKDYLPSLPGVINTEKASFSATELIHHCSHIVSAVNEAVKDYNGMCDVINANAGENRKKAAPAPVPKLDRDNAYNLLKRNPSEQKFDTDAYNQLSSKFITDIKNFVDLARTPMAKTALTDITNAQEKLKASMSDYKGKFIDNTGSADAQTEALKNISANIKELHAVVETGKQYLEEDAYSTMSVRGLDFYADQVRRNIIDRQIAANNKSSYTAPEYTDTELLGMKASDYSKLPDGEPAFVRLRSNVLHTLDSKLSDISSELNNFKCYDQAKNADAEAILKDVKSLLEGTAERRESFNTDFYGLDTQDRQLECLKKTADGIKNLCGHVNGFVSSYLVTGVEKNVSDSANSLVSIYGDIQRDIEAVSKQISPSSNVNRDSISYIRPWEAPQKDYGSISKELAQDLERRSKAVNDIRARKWKFNGDVHSQLQDRLSDGITKALDCLKQDHDIKDGDKYLSIANAFASMKGSMDVNPFGNFHAFSNQDIERAHETYSRNYATVAHNMRFLLADIAAVSDSSVRNEFYDVYRDVIKCLNISREDANVMDSLDHDSSPYNPLQDNSGAVKAAPSRKEKPVVDRVKEESERDLQQREKFGANLEKNPMRINKASVDKLEEDLVKIADKLVKASKEGISYTEQAGLLTAAGCIMAAKETLSLNKELFVQNPQDINQWRELDTFLKCFSGIRGNVYDAMQDIYKCTEDTVSMNRGYFENELRNIQPVINDAISDFNNMHNYTRDNKQSRLSLQNAINHAKESITRDNELKQERENAKYKPHYHVQLSGEEQKEMSEYMKFREATEANENWKKELQQKEELEKQEKLRKTEEEKQEALRKERELKEKQIKEKEEKKKEAQEIRNNKLKELGSHHMLKPDYLDSLTGSMYNIAIKLEALSKTSGTTAEKKLLADSAERLLNARNGILQNKSAMEFDPDMWTDSAEKRQLLNHLIDIRKLPDGAMSIASKMITDPQEKALFNDRHQLLSTCIRMAINEHNYHYYLENDKAAPELEKPRRPANVENQAELIQDYRDMINGTGKYAPENNEEAQNQEEEEVEEVVDNNGTEPVSDASDVRPVQENVNEAPKTIENTDSPAANASQLRNNVEAEQDNPVNDIVINNAPRQQPADRILDFTKLSDEDAYDANRQYATELERLAKELKNTDSSYSNDSEPYKKLRTVLTGTVALMKKPEYANSTAADKNKLFRTVFKEIDENIRDYREAHSTGKLSNRQARRLKVMNRIDMLSNNYRKGRIEVTDNYEKKLAEKLVNNQHLQHYNETPNAKKLANRADFNEQVKEFRRSDVFKQYVNKLGNNLEKTVKTNGVKVLNEFNKWMKDNKKSYSLFDSNSAPEKKSSARQLR